MWHVAILLSPPYSYPQDSQDWSQHPNDNERHFIPHIPASPLPPPMMESMTTWPGVSRTRNEPLKPAASVMSKSWQRTSTARMTTSNRTFRRVSRSLHQCAHFRSPPAPRRALPSLIGINSTLMFQYIELVACSLLFAVRQRETPPLDEPVRLHRDGFTPGQDQLLRDARRTTPKRASPRRRPG